MALQQLRNCDFGRTKANATGSFGVGYEILDVTGVTVIPRTTSGVYQTAPGIYAAYVSFPDDFRGSIVWDTGTTFLTASYASEEYNVEQNNPKVEQLYDIQYGRWKIENNKMLFYKEDNATLIAEFDLFDENGNPSMDAVFDRQKV